MKELTDWNTIRDCDVIITSSSRLDMLKITLDYFDKNVCAHFHGNLRFILHEDFVIPSESEKLVKWAKNSKYFKQENIHCHKNPIGLDKSMIFLIDKVKTPFFVYLQDDWVFERPIELDKVIYMMEKMNEINLILFYKYKIPFQIAGIKLKEYFFKRFPQFLTLYRTWEFIPGIWRYDFVKDRFKKSIDNSNRTAPAKWNSSLRSCDDRENYDYLYDNVGVFMWGGFKEPRWVRHIGENARMEAWRLDRNGNPGKEGGVTQEKNILNMARWIPFEHIPPIKGRNSIEMIIKKQKQVNGRKKK